MIIRLASIALLLSACAGIDLNANGGGDASDARVESGTDATPTDDLPTCQGCPIWSVRCGAQCVDLTNSPDNCGACGAACASNEACQGGVCVPAGRCVYTDAGAPASDAGTAASHAGDAGGEIPSGTTMRPGLRGEYYGNTNLSGARFVRIDPNVNFDWSTTAPDPSLGMENYSVQWTGTVVARASGTYTFQTTSDDGVRLWVDNHLLIDDWTGHGATLDEGTITLAAGTSYDIVLQYYQGVGGATIHLAWSVNGDAMQPVPQSQLFAASDPPAVCTDGFCCDTGGAAPVCCATGTRCVRNANFAGCCPNGESCGSPAACIPPADAGR